jgi:hypothetical protein
MQPLADPLWFIIDLVFPCAQPLSKAESQEQEARDTAELVERDNRVAALPDREDILSEYLGECAKLLEREEGRRQSVDGRLTSIMGLSSIAGTIVFGSILAQATGTLHAQRVCLRWIMALGAVYLTLQLCNAILAAVCGLSRRAYVTPTATDVLPLQIEARPIYLRRRITTCLTALADHQSQNNQKVTWMAVAHRAVINFLGGLLLLVLFGAYYGVTTRHNNDLTETLKKNHELHELLRGPQGPPGPPGSRGEPCTNQPPPSPRKRHGGRP